MCNTWNDLKEQIPKVENRKFRIKNTNTGKYICDEKGRDKLFNSADEAKLYIKTHRLTSIFEICDVDY